jgi:hypothetical protein
VIQPASKQPTEAATTFLKEVECYKPGELWYTFEDTAQGFPSSPQNGYIHQYETISIVDSFPPIQQVFILYCIESSVVDWFLCLHWKIIKEANGIGVVEFKKEGIEKLPTIENGTDHP